MIKHILTLQARLMTSLNIKILKTTGNGRLNTTITALYCHYAAGQYCINIQNFVNYISFIYKHKHVEISFSKFDQALIIYF